MCRDIERRRRVGIGFVSVLRSKVGNCCSLFKCLIPLWKFFTATKKGAVGTEFNCLVTEEEKTVMLLETMVVK